ncbi:MAG: 50S ribosomal protein L30 [Candidatus Micrarchaeia archaeon]
MEQKTQKKEAGFKPSRNVELGKGGSVVIVRIRGMRTTPRRAEHTMLLMNLSRKFHATILPDDAITRGMVLHAKDFITWGKAGSKTFEDLFAKHGRTVDGKPLTDAYVKVSTDFSSVKELAAAVHSGKTRLSRVKAVKAVFRLQPARKGFGSIKAIFPEGALGARDEKSIDSLLVSMM